MDNIDESFNQKVFENPNFDIEKYVQSIATKSLFATDLIETKEKLNKTAEKTAEEIKQSVYNNYSNFMETSKEVGHLEGKMTQLRQSLDEQKKLLNLFKNINISERQAQSNAHMLVTDASKPNVDSVRGGTSTEKSSLAMLLEEVEGCGVVTQKPGRELLYHGDLEALNSTDFILLHKVHAYLLTDALLITLPLRKRTIMKQSGKTKDQQQHQYKFQAFYELQDINITNLNDRREVRNAFQILKFPESLLFRCANAHVKKEWLENIEQAKKQLKYERQTLQNALTEQSL
jgi:hypothetical protein